MQPQSHTGSYYAATVNDVTDFAPLSGEQSADVCVIGAGFTGISTALHLAERGYDVHVVEANKIGWGAPSGGEIPPGKKTELGEKIQHGVYGAHKIWEKHLPKETELAHLVITHTRASNTRSESYEAALLFYADWGDSDAGIILGGGKPFSARWIEGK